jgi:transmembrane 9 superfamily protein 2/4
VVENVKTKEKSYLYERGFAIGFMGDKANPRTTEGVAYVYNHLSIHVLYHRVTTRAEKGARIVGFEVTPYSMKHDHTGSVDGSTKLQTPRALANYEHQSIAEGLEIVYSYDVTWEASPIRWASRWDM